MDKIIYKCNACEMDFTFPKRKWWDIYKLPREAMVEFTMEFSGEEVPVCVQISEKSVGKREVVIPPFYQEEIERAFIDSYKKGRNYQALLVVDCGENEFAHLIRTYAEDINYLAILTRRPQEYEYLLEELETEYGLFGMVFTAYRDFLQYQGIVRADRGLVFLGSGIWTEENGGQRTFFRFPKGCRVLDFECSCIKKKRCCGSQKGNNLSDAISVEDYEKGKPYITMGVFLDNIIKSGYNSLVNEGLQINKGQGYYLQQNVTRPNAKNRLGEQRKGFRKWKKRRIS